MLQLNMIYLMKLDMNMLLRHIGIDQHNSGTTKSHIIADTIMSRFITTTAIQITMRR